MLMESPSTRLGFSICSSAMRPQQPFLSFVFVPFVSFLLIHSVTSDLVNSHVKRIIDVTTTTAVIRATITFKNTGKHAVSTYTVLLPPEDARLTHDIWVLQSSSSKPLKLTTQSNEFNLTKSLSFQLPVALQPDESTSIDLRMDVTNAAPAVPAQLSGHDAQYLRYRGSAHFYSLYETESEQTTLILASGSVTSKKGIPSPSSLNGKRMELGPYSNIAARTITPFSLRYRSDIGFLIASRAVKEVQVGHWGTVSVMEEFELRNGAAQHTGEWSRLDYSEGYGNSYKMVLGDVWANLPPKATNVAYRDLIGNITTSRLREPTTSKRAVQLTFRFPLMGGWHNHFWFTYDVPQNSVVSAVNGKTNRFSLEIPLWPTLNHDLQCEIFELRVILPEWAENVQVADHPSINFHVSTGSERLSVTMLGRQVVTLRAEMIRSKSKHEKFIKIQYTYNPAMRWVTPSLTIAGVLMVITVSMLTVLRTIDVSDVAISKKKTQ